MKRLLTAFGMCVLLVSAGTVFATDFIWDGDTDTDWTTQGNWTAGSSYPGDPWGGGDSDTASISGSPTHDPQLSQDETIASLSMADGTSGSPRTITIDEGYTLTVSGTFTVTDTNSSCYIEKLGLGAISCGTLSVQGGDSAGETATLKVSAGTVSTS